MKQFQSNALHDAADTQLSYDVPDYLNVFVAAGPSPLKVSDGHIRTMFCCSVVNQECVTFFDHESVVQLLKFIM